MDMVCFCFAALLVMPTVEKQSGEICPYGGTPLWS